MGNVTSSSEKTNSHKLAERALIGAILMNPDHLAQTKIFVTEDHFHIDLHRDIWRAMVNLEMAGEPIDLITVNDSLKGNPTDLLELVEEAPVSQNMEHYSKIVLKQWGDRRARLIIDSSILLPEVPLNRLVDRLSLLQIELETVSPGSKKWDGPTNRIVDSIKNGVQLQQIMNQEAFPKLNEISQVARGDLIVLGAQTSMGKTAFALRYCTGLIEAGYKGMYFIYEGSDDTLQRRVIAQTTGIKLARLKKVDNLTDEEKDKVYEVAPIFEDQLHYEGEATGIDSLINMVKLEKKKGRVDFVCIDHIHLMPVEGNIRTGMMELTKKLVKMGRDEEILCIAIAQFKKEDGDKIAERPDGNSLRESATIKQDAHHIWLLHDPEFLENKTKTMSTQAYDDSSFVGQTRMPSAEIIVEKNREGNTGIIPAKFDRTTGIWTETKT